jgi:ERCC4-related helicase
MLDVWQWFIQGWTNNLVLVDTMDRVPADMPAGIVNVHFVYLLVIDEYFG